MQIWGQRRSQSIKHRLPAICSAFCWRTDAPLELSTRFGPTSTSETRKWHSHFSGNMVIWLRNCCCKQVLQLANWLDKYKICTFESPCANTCSQSWTQARKIMRGYIPRVMSCVVYRATAQQKPLLVNLGITHVLNAADGPRHIDTGPHFYKDTNIQYHGVEAPDCKDFDLSPFFTETADFIHGALSQKGTSHTKQTRQMKLVLILLYISYSTLYCGIKMRRFFV